MTTTTAATKTKTTKTATTKPNPNLQHTRQVVQTAVEYTKQCLAIVHRYIELPEAEDERQLLRDVHFITRAHYEDITEERACADLCGYPLCGSVLSKCLQGSKGFKPAQRYHIKANKVYDISRRRNFCSDGCFRCSEHLAGQISTEPGYLRPASSASICTITLLSKEETKKSGRGLPGEEVKLVDPLIKDLAEKDEEEAEGDEKEKEHKKSKTSTTITKLTKTTAEEVVLTDRAKVTALRADRRVETQLQSPYIKDEEFKELRGKFRRMAIKEKNISANGVALGLLPKTEEEEENESEENDSDDDDV